MSSNRPNSLLETPSAELRLELLDLLAARSFRSGTIKLSSGKISDFYIDVKQTSLHARGSLLLGWLLTERLSAGPKVEAVGGLTLGADPLVSAITVCSSIQEASLNGFLIRKAPKGHGTERWLEGADALPAGTPVAIVEDVSTTGASILEAVERANAHGLHVLRTLTVVDRLEGASELLAKKGLELETLFTRTDFFPALLEP